MFKVTVDLQLVEEGEYPSFQQAWKRLYDEVTARFLTGGMSYLELEQACWITFCDSLPLSFYDSRDLAYRVGLMNEKTKNLIEKPEPMSLKYAQEIARTFDVSTEKIIDTFTSTDQAIETEFKMLKKALFDILKGNTQRKIEEYEDDSVFISCDHGNPDGMFWILFKSNGTFKIGIPEDAS